MIQISELQVNESHLEASVSQAHQQTKSFLSILVNPNIAVLKQQPLKIKLLRTQPVILSVHTQLLDS